MLFFIFASVSDNCIDNAHAAKVLKIETVSEKKPFEGDTIDELEKMRQRRKKEITTDIRDDPPFEKNKNNPTFNQAEKILANAGNNINSENIAQVDEQIEQNIVRILDGTYLCNICGKNAGKKLSNMKNHIETHLEGLSFSCALCERTYKSRNSLAHHRLKMHKNN